VGVRARVTYEGQAAIELEALAARASPAAVPTYDMGSERRHGVLVLDPAPLVAAVVEDTERGTDPAAVAAGFHRALGLAAAAAAVEVARGRGLDTVALSGGVFQNALLTSVVSEALDTAGLLVLTHREVPPNDGGISVGQAAIAALADAPAP